MEDSTEFIAAYQHALNFFREKKYEEALEEIAKIRGSILRWSRLDLLQAYIYRDQGRYLSEANVLADALKSVQKEDHALAAAMWSLLGGAWHTLGQPRRALAAFLQSVEHEPEAEKKRAECSNALFAASSISGYSPEEYRSLYRRYRSLTEDIVPFPLRFHRHGKLRIGYLSPDFREHPLACFLWAFLRCHDRERFRVYCYASNANGVNDWVTEKLRGEAEEWRDISACSDESAADLIRRDEIDVLFDLSGHTSDNCLAIMAYHPATVQISGIGDVNSTGLECIEYFWGDRNSYKDEEAARLYFTEKILKDMESSVCYAPLREMPEAKEAPCLARDGVTFGCFNNFSKVTDEMLSAWAEVLERVPKSRLYLKHRIFGSEEGRAFALERFRRVGLDGARVDMGGFSRDYLKEYKRVDIALDTYPYVGCITTCEALYVGVPVVTLYGQRLGTRFGYSILKNLGIEELAAGSYDEYIDRAVALAGDRQLVALLHRNLRGMMRRSSLMNMQKYMQEVEEVYQKIWFKARVSRGHGP